MMYLLVLGGLAFLLIGGDALVRGAVAIGERTGLTQVVVGMVIVGFGTSTPELFVSVQSSLAGAGGIALGNVVGSNIANILLILGAAALVSPIARPRAFFITDGVILLVATLILLGFCLSGTLDQLQGLILVAALVAFVVFQVARCYVASEAALEATGLGGSAEPEAPTFSFAAAAMLLLFGFVALWIGSQMLVAGAVDLARSFQVSEALIGITIVAIGTSLPELASTVTASLRGHTGVVYGSIVGSNIFNTLGIIGAAALVAPLGIPPELLTIDGPAVLGVAAVMLLAMATGHGISRFEGVLMLILYVVFVVMRASLDTAPDVVAMAVGA